MERTVWMKIFGCRLQKIPPPLSAMVPSSAARVIRRAASTAKTAKVADVAIVGAGIWGMNTAFQLKRRSPELNVQVFEQAPALGYGSSGYSTGFLRAYYSFDETMELPLSSYLSAINF